MRHEMVNQRELVYKSLKSEGERLWGKKHIEAEDMSKRLSVGKKKKEGE